MTTEWTDNRLDEFAQRMDERFDHVGKDIGHVRVEVRDGFERVDTDLRELRAEMNTRLDSLHRTMIWFSGSLVVSLFGLVVTLLFMQA